MWFSESFCKIIWLSLVGIILTGCGGSSSTPAPPAVVVNPNLAVPLQTAMANLVNNGYSKPYTLTGWVDNSTSTNPNLPHTPLSGSGTVTLGTPVSITFTSGPLTGVGLKSVVIFTGTAASTSTYYFNTANYTILAITVGTNNYIYTPYTLPSTVKAGNTGAIGNSTTGGLLGGYNTTGVYSVASDRADSLLVSFIERMTPPYGGGEKTTTVYRINTLGAISPVSIQVDYYYGTSLYKSVVLTF